MSDAANSHELDQTPIQSDKEIVASRRLSLQTADIPANVAGYEILRCLGQGSFGTVWLARERKTGRQVAIKFFTNRRGLDWALLTREVEKLAVLDSSRDVVRLLDVGWDHQPPYFVMEHLEVSVARLLEDGPMPVEKALEITRAVARALVHSHSAGILHCDIKPANVLLDRGDEARLGDFGQSRMSTDQSAALGTFYYMAPEQAAPNSVPDVRWDVYAVGAILYHMLTGHPPFRTPESEAKLVRETKLADRLEIYRKILSNSPPPNAHREVRGVDQALIDLIDGALQRDPALRTPTAQKILDQLDKREQARTRRPLIWMGFLGPVLFLITLFWVASWAIPNAVGQAKTHLFERALASDTATVHLLAASIEQELQDRQAELERCAESLVAANSGELRDDLQSFMYQWCQDSEKRLRYQHRTEDQSLFVNNTNGEQIFRYPEAESLGKSFKYRDYFHGLGKELNPNDDLSRVEPRRIPGVSLAFRSVNTRQFMVAISVPIWNSSRDNVIGVLARTIHISDLLSQWERRIRGKNGKPARSDDRSLSLIDMREELPYLLDHHWMTVKNLQALDDDISLKHELLQLSDFERSQLETALDDHQGQVTSYRDPLADEFKFYDDQWLAAVARIENVNWIAVVQERSDEAVAPMRELYLLFLRYGFILLALFGVILAGLWLLLQRIWKQE